MADEFDDEPTLPTLPSLPVGAGAADTGRKRAFHLNTTFTEPAYSSDLGVFSSDDDPGLDNYLSGRHKRRYRGAWYDHSRETGAPDEDEKDERTPRKPVREVIVQDADDQGSVPPSSGSTWTTWTQQTSPPSSQNTSLPTWAQMSPSSSQKASLPVCSVLTKQTALIQEVIRQIDNHIDHGDETIDLFGLTDARVVPETFERLCKLKFVPRLDLEVERPDEGKYLHRESKIKLLMPNNRLTRIPGTIFAIENLTYLSLRGNKLTELPPAIGQCRNLAELNVAYNKLRHLPFELIEMMPGLTLYSYGNAFYEVENRCVEDWGDYTSSEPLREGERETEIRAFYMGRGAVQFTDTAGRVYSSFKVPTWGGSKNPIDLALQDTPPTARYQGQHKQATGHNLGWTTRVPSLAELCARSLARAGQNEPYADLTGEAELVATAYEAVGRALDRGGQWCAVCGGSFVTARTQWVEFYHCFQSVETVAGPVPLAVHDEKPNTAPGRRKELLKWLYPSLRKGCSWKCVPYGTEPERFACVPLKSRGRTSSEQR